jgi:hypothetical protein
MCQAFGYRLSMSARPIARLSPTLAPMRTKVSSSLIAAEPADLNGQGA